MIIIRITLKISLCQIERLQARRLCPKNAAETRPDHRAEIEKLRQQKSEAVSNEEYGLAAEIKSKVFGKHLCCPCKLGCALDTC